MTTRSEIRHWLNEARAQGATHMIVKWDSFDGPEGDYPVLVMPGENPHEVAASHSDPVVEVYAMHLDIDAQLREHRAFHWDAAPPPGPITASAAWPEGRIDTRPTTGDVL